MAISSHRYTAALLASTATLLLTGCDKEKDPLPGERASYLSFGSVTLQPDVSLASRAVVVPKAQPWDTFTQSLVNNDSFNAPIQIQEREEAAWTVNVGASTDMEHKFISHPVSDGRFIYTSDAYGKITAVKIEDGAVEWEFDTIPEDKRDNAFGAGLAIDGKTLYVGTAMGEVIALDLTRGAEGTLWRTRQLIWRVNVDAPIRVVPAVRGDRVFVTTIDGRTLALSKKDGKTVWTHQGLSEVSSILGGASPVVRDEYVVASYSSGEVHVVRADAGTPVWSETITTALRTDSISSIPHIVGNPIVENSMLYVVSHGGRTAAFDLASGLTTWQQDLGSVRSPVLLGDFMFMLDNTNNVVCLEKSSGKIAWIAKIPTSSEGAALSWTSPLAVNDKLVLASSSGKVIFLSLAKGHVVREFDLKEGVSVPPIAVKGALYFLLDSGSLVKY